MDEGATVGLGKEDTGRGVEAIKVGKEVIAAGSLEGTKVNEIEGNTVGTVKGNKIGVAEGEKLGTLRASKGDADGVVENTVGAVDGQVGGEVD